jgi:peptide subunit release factor 1 (eRF1)
MVLREIGTSRNIKDKSTGKKVYKALDRIIEFLKTYPDISNGLWILSAYDGL